MMICFPLWEIEAFKLIDFKLRDSEVQNQIEDIVVPW